MVTIEGVGDAEPVDAAGTKASDDEPMDAETEAADDEQPKPEEAPQWQPQHAGGRWNQWRSAKWASSKR